MGLLAFVSADMGSEDRSDLDIVFEKWSGLFGQENAVYK